MSLLRRLGAVLAVTVALAGLLVSARVVVVATCAPSDASRIQQQVDQLDRSGMAGAARMQQLFPEGAFFTRTLTGLAAGNLALRGQAPGHNRAVLDRAVADTASMGATFGSTQPLRYGVFYRGWRLLLLTQQAELSEDPYWIDALGREASAVLRAIDSTPSGFPSSYPGQYWPCDTVVAMAAVHQAGQVTSVPGLQHATTTWLARYERIRDGRTGLPAHRVDAGGTVLEGYRATSSSLVAAFMPDISSQVGTGTYRSFTGAMMVRRAGLIGVREFDGGGTGDVDSGPLVFGVSPSASAVTLAAARRNGDMRTAGDLDREGELVGLPVPTRAGRAFFFAQLPVGDAWAAWARSIPGPAHAAPQVTPASSPRPLWWLIAAVPSLPALAVAGFLVHRHRRARRAGAARPV